MDGFDHSVGPAYRHGPGGGSTHHDTFDDCLPSDGGGGIYRLPWLGAALARRHSSLAGSAFSFFFVKLSEP